MSELFDKQFVAAKVDGAAEEILIKLEAAVEIEIRRLLEFLDINASYETPVDVINMQLQQKGLTIAHITFQQQPEMDGWWLLEDDIPIIGISHPWTEKGRIKIKRIIPPWNEGAKA